MTEAPGRGDIVWVNFDPTLEHEQAGRRPALVISPAAYNERVNLALVCPVTNRSKGYAFEVEIPPGLPVAAVVFAITFGASPGTSGARVQSAICPRPSPSR